MYINAQKNSAYNLFYVSEVFKMISIYKYGILIYVRRLNQKLGFSHSKFIDLLGFGSFINFQCFNEYQL